MIEQMTTDALHAELKAIGEFGSERAETIIAELRRRYAVVEFAADVMQQ